MTSVNVARKQNHPGVLCVFGRSVFRLSVGLVSLEIRDLRECCHSEAGDHTPCGAVEQFQNLFFRPTQIHPSPITHGSPIYYFQHWGGEASPMIHPFCN